MILLVSGATKDVRMAGQDMNIGALITPQSGNKPPTDIPWAADNAAYSNWDEKKFVRMLNKISQEETKPIFVACPDVVGNAIETAKQFRCWQPLIKEYNFPVALVLQDGQESIGVPWHEVDAVFIGGTNDFKLGQYVRYIVGAAKEKGKWVHMGRVNSQKRAKYAQKIGCDSIDGTHFSIEPKTIHKFLRFLKKEQHQLFL